MTHVTYEIVQHDGGWAYRVDGVYSETFRTHDAAKAAAKRAAGEQRVAGDTAGITWEDAGGRWHEEVVRGRRPPGHRRRGLSPERRWPTSSWSPACARRSSRAAAPFAQYDALAISAPVAKAMAARARPDFIVWGEVIPEATVSNIARELVFEAGLDPDHPGVLHRARLLDQLHGHGRGRRHDRPRRHAPGAGRRRGDHEPRADRAEDGRSPTS